jgi:glycosidase
MTFAFHISRDARDRYDVEDELFTITGNAILPNFAAGRRLAQAINDTIDTAREPDRVVRPGELNAMGLLDEILHAAVDLYRRQVNRAAMSGALTSIGDRVGPDRVARTLENFVERFPTTDVVRAATPPAVWLQGVTDGIPNREIALEELLMLWISNANPALTSFEMLFDDAPLADRAPYRDVVAGLIAYFGTQPPFGPDGQTLIELLRAPAISVPDSIAGQLRFVRERWGLVLNRFGDRLLVSLDVLEEEEQAVWRQFHPAGQGGGAEDAVQRASRAWLTESGWYGTGGEPEPERFSMDRDWMPRLVLVAKSAFVWLDQLSKRHRRSIARLDEIPDEELDTLARRGFTGLWLIGLWQRSRASQAIKQLRGNPEAVASAYSLDDYRIADDLGGEEAFERLKARAWSRGIRIGSDMVPNHMGVDSRWVAEHPDWFMSLPEPPYPAYSFTGPDLSADDRVGIQIEDHYFDNTDAAVVFKRWDRGTGETRFIYHGNDGTSMPWNDTAQLDYLNPEVREAVIRTILGVARRSPVIRFDAAMTLAKRHIERLWYPEPGHGGGIPSRAEHSMTKDAFEKAMPVEFWREVVDRVATEVPDTLLLAEAFWLMEGYFVRTLGMHRVYNSAFMNMMRDELNAEYRAVIRNTIEFDPEVLKRYVNFMNNPDERTAVDQFGKGDKYFGVATVMATMPGLPMFGHGQVEGFTEKYGMEYRRAYWDEQPDPWLIERHDRELAPLLHRRHLFAEVDDFLFYDFVRDDGSVDEDVFAFSNRGGGDASLVVYHNRYKSTAGRLRESAAYMARAADGTRSLARRTLAAGLGIHAEDGWFLVLRDARSGLENLRASREVHEQGLHLSLDAYACRIFVGMREVQESPGMPWGRLAADLAGREVASVEEALRDLLLRPVQEPLRRLLEPARLRRVAAADGSDEAALREDVAASLAAARALLGDKSAGDASAVDRLARAIASAVSSAAKTSSAVPQSAASNGTDGSDGDAAADTSTDSSADASDAANGTAEARPTPVPTSSSDLGPDDGSRPDGPSPSALTFAAAFALFHDLAAALGRSGDGDRSREWIDEWRLAPAIADAFRGNGLAEQDAWRAVEALKAFLTLPRWDLRAPKQERVGRIVATWLADESVARVLQVNVYRDVRWFNKEAFETFAAWAALAQRVAMADGTDTVDIDATVSALNGAAEDAGYRLDALQGSSRPASPARGGASSVEG